MKRLLGWIIFLSPLIVLLGFATYILPELALIVFIGLLFVSVLAGMVTYGAKLLEK